MDAIVLSSIYKSHETGDRDVGYDVVSHTDISSEYGTLEDVQRLLEEAHSRGG